MRLKWSTVKRMSSSRFAQLLVIVPVIGWLLVLNDEFAGLLADLTGRTQLATPGWQIYAFHAGLSLFGLGVLVYQLTCPPEIGQSASRNSFVDAELSLMTRDRFRTYSERVPDAPRVPGKPSLAGDPESRDLWLARNKENVIAVLDAIYTWEDTQRRTWLSWTAMAFLLGGAFLAMLPSANTILWSLGEFFKTVGG